MKILVDIHPDWSPGAVAELVARLRAFENPPSMLTTASTPAPPIREPATADEDLSVLLGGMDEPEPAPAVSKILDKPPPSPYVPPLATPASRRPAPAGPFDGVPRTGQALYRIACSAKRLPQVNAWGKEHGCHRLVTQWDEKAVAACWAALQTEAPGAYPVGNGRR